MANPGSELCKPVRPAHTPLAWPIKHNQVCPSFTPCHLHELYVPPPVTEDIPSQNLRNLAFTYEPRLGGYSRGTNITAQPLKVPKVIRERPLSSRFQKSRVSYNWYPCCCHYQPLPPSPALYIMSTFRISRRSESTQENATNDINRVLPSETEVSRCKRLNNMPPLNLRCTSHRILAYISRHCNMVQKNPIVVMGRYVSNKCCSVICRLTCVMHAAL